MKVNKSELMKKAWEYLKLWKKFGKEQNKSLALKYAWRDMREEDEEEDKLSDDLWVNDCYRLSWEEVKGYLSGLTKRTKTFWSIAKLVYEKGKFSTHRKEFNSLYHAVPK